MELDANNKIIDGELWLTADSIGKYFEKSKGWAYITQNKKGMEVKRIKSKKGIGSINLFSVIEFDVYLKNVKGQRDMDNKYFEVIRNNNEQH